MEGLICKLKSAAVHRHHPTNMNEHEPISDNESLSKTLREWKVSASLPPRFQEQVWQRIARSRPQLAQRSRWEALVQWVETAFSRPALAVSYVTVLLFAGVSTGYWQAQGKAGRAVAQGRMLYVQSVDPFKAPRR